MNPSRLRLYARLLTCKGLAWSIGADALSICATEAHRRSVEADECARTVQLRSEGLTVLDQHVMSTVDRSRRLHPAGGDQ